MARGGGPPNTWRITGSVFDGAPEIKSRIKIKIKIKITSGSLRIVDAVVVAGVLRVLASGARVQTMYGFTRTIDEDD